MRTQCWTSPTTFDPLSDFKRNTSELLDRLKKTGNPLVLTINRKAEVVVQDAEAYQELLERVETIESLQRGLADVKAGRTKPAREVFNPTAAQAWPTALRSRKALEAQLEELYLWVVERAPSQGLAWFNRLEEAMLSLDLNPERCPIAPEKLRSRPADSGPRTSVAVRTFIACSSQSMRMPTSFGSSTSGVERGRDPHLVSSKASRVVLVFKNYPLAGCSILARHAGHKSTVDLAAVDAHRRGRRGRDRRRRIDHRSTQSLPDDREMGPAPRGTSVGLDERGRRRAERQSVGRRALRRQHLRRLERAADPRVRSVGEAAQELWCGTADLSARLSRRPRRQRLGHRRAGHATARGTRSSSSAPTASS